MVLDMRQRLVRNVQRLEQLDLEKREAGEALKAAFEEAAAQGFDRSTLMAILRLRKLTPAQRKERRALEAIYLAALGMLEGDALPEEARRRLSGAPPQPPQPPPPPASADAKGSKDASENAGDAAKKPAKPAPAQATLALKDPKEAQAEGREAAKAGKRIYDNPYPAGDPCRAAWDEGWCEGRGSHGMDTPDAYQRRTDPKPEDTAVKKGAAK